MVPVNAQGDLEKVRDLLGDIGRYAGSTALEVVLVVNNFPPQAPPAEIADLERLHYAVGNSIALHKYSGAALPSKRGKGLDYTLGEGAVSLGRRTGYDYALFLYAQDNIASTGRTALQVLGVAGCFIGFCAPSGGSNQFAYASLVDLRTGEVVWFNVAQASSQVAGIKFGDIRTDEGAGADGRSAARPDEARPQCSAARAQPIERTF